MAIRVFAKTLPRAAALLFGAAVLATPVAAAEHAAGPPVQDGYGRTVTAATNNRTIVYGIVTRAMLFADDGDRHQLFMVDGGVENTRVGWIVTGALGRDVAVIGHVEMNVPLSNPAAGVNLDGVENAVTQNWETRIQEVAFAHKRFGRLSLGQGNTASTDRVVMDLSGTELANGNNPADMAGGIHFFNRTDRTRAVTLGDVFDKVDGIDKDNRVRYDLPEFGSFNLAVSHTDVDALTVRAAAFYANVAGISDTRKDMWGGSGSIKHESGLNFTIAGAVRNQKAATVDDARYLWGKIGYSAALNGLGGTHFGLSYGEYKNFAQNGDKAIEMGFGIVQDIESVGSHLWLLARNHQLNRANNNDFHDVFIVSLGTLVNF